MINERQAIGFKLSTLQNISVGLSCERTKLMPQWKSKAAPELRRNIYNNCLQDKTHIFHRLKRRRLLRHEMCASNKRLISGPGPRLQIVPFIKWNAWFVMTPVSYFINTHTYTYTRHMNNSFIKFHEKDEGENDMTWQCRLNDMTWIEMESFVTNMFDRNAFYCYMVSYLQWRFHVIYKLRH